MKKKIHPVLYKTSTILTNGSSSKNFIVYSKNKHVFLDLDNKSHYFWNNTKVKSNIEVGGRRAKFQKRFNNI